MVGFSSDTDNADPQDYTGKDVIVLARHGKPALSRKVYLTAKEFVAWWGKYDEGGLAEDQTPRKETLKAAQRADIVISSTLRRAIESAQLLRAIPADKIMPEFVEARLPPPYLGPLKFKPKVWGTISRIVWFFGYSQGQERVGEARIRAKVAASIVEAEAAGGRFVFVAAHGWFNRMIGTQLKRKGWRLTKNQGDLHWCHRRYERETKLEKPV